MCRLFWSTTRPVMLQLYQTPRATTFHAQKALIRIGFRVGTANRFKFLRTHTCTSFKCERCQATFHRHHKHMLTAILLAHMALGSIDFIVWTTHEIRPFRCTVGIALSRCCTICQRHRNNTRATSFLLHIAQRTICVTIWATHWARERVFRCAWVCAFKDGRFELCACTDMSHVYAAPIEIRQS